MYSVLYLLYLTLPFPSQGNHDLSSHPPSGSHSPTPPSSIHPHLLHHHTTPTPISNCNNNNRFSNHSGGGHEDLTNQHAVATTAGNRLPGNKIIQNHHQSSRPPPSASIPINSTHPTIIKSRTQSDPTLLDNMPHHHHHSPHQKARLGRIASQGSAPCSSPSLSPRSPMVQELGRESVEGVAQHIASVKALWQGREQSASPAPATPPGRLATPPAGNGGKRTGAEVFSFGANSTTKSRIGSDKVPSPSYGGGGGQDAPSRGDSRGSDQDPLASTHPEFPPSYPADLARASSTFSSSGSFTLDTVEPHTKTPSSSHSHSSFSEIPSPRSYAASLRFVETGGGSPSSPSPLHQLDEPSTIRGPMLRTNVVYGSHEEDTVSHITRIPGSGFFDPSQTQSQADFDLPVTTTGLLAGRRGVGEEAGPMTEEKQEGLERKGKKSRKSPLRLAKKDRIPEEVEGGGEERDGVGEKKRGEVTVSSSRALKKKEKETSSSKRPIKKRAESMHVGSDGKTGDIQFSPEHRTVSLSSPIRKVSSASLASPTHPATPTSNSATPITAMVRVSQSFREEKSPTPPGGRGLVKLGSVPNLPTPSPPSGRSREVTPISGGSGSEGGASSSSQGKKRKPSLAQRIMNFMSGGGGKDDTKPPTPNMDNPVVLKTYKVFEEDVFSPPPTDPAPPSSSITLSPPDPGELGPVISDVSISSGTTSTEGLLSGGSRLDLVSSSGSFSDALTTSGSEPALVQSGESKVAPPVSKSSSSKASSSKASSKASSSKASSSKASSKTSSKSASKISSSSSSSSSLVGKKSVSRVKKTSSSQEKKSIGKNSTPFPRGVKETSSWTKLSPMSSPVAARKTSAAATSTSSLRGPPSGRKVSAEPSLGKTASSKKTSVMSTSSKNGPMSSLSKPGAKGKEVVKKTSKAAASPLTTSTSSISPSSPAMGRKVPSIRKTSSPATSASKSSPRNSPITPRKTSALGSPSPSSRTTIVKSGPSPGTSPKSSPLSVKKVSSGTLSSSLLLAKESAKVHKGPSQSSSLAPPSPKASPVPSKRSILVTSSASPTSGSKRAITVSSSVTPKASPLLNKKSSSSSPKPGSSSPPKVSPQLKRARLSAGSSPQSSFKRATPGSASTPSPQSSFKRATPSTSSGPSPRSSAGKSKLSVGSASPPKGSSPQSSVRKPAGPRIAKVSLDSSKPLPDSSGRFERFSRSRQPFKLKSPDQSKVSSPLPPKRTSEGGKPARPQTLPTTAEEEDPISPLTPLTPRRRKVGMSMTESPMLSPTTSSASISTTVSGGKEKDCFLPPKVAAAGMAAALPSSNMDMSVDSLLAGVEEKLGKLASTTTTSQGSDATKDEDDEGKKLAVADFATSAIFSTQSSQSSIEFEPENLLPQPITGIRGVASSPLAPDILSLSPKTSPVLQRPNKEKGKEKGKEKEASKKPTTKESSNLQLATKAKKKQSPLTVKKDSPVLNRKGSTRSQDGTHTTLTSAKSDSAIKSFTTARPPKPPSSLRKGSEPAKKQSASTASSGSASGSGSGSSMGTSRPRLLISAATSSSSGASSKKPSPGPSKTQTTPTGSRSKSLGRVSVGQLPVEGPARTQRSSSIDVGLPPSRGSALNKSIRAKTSGRLRPSSATASSRRYSVAPTPATGSSSISPSSLTLQRPLTGQSSARKSMRRQSVMPSSASSSSTSSLVPRASQTLNRKSMRRSSSTDLLVVKKPPRPGEAGEKKKKSSTGEDKKKLGLGVTAVGTTARTSVYATMRRPSSASAHKLSGGGDTGAATSFVRNVTTMSMRRMSKGGVAVAGAAGLAQKLPETPPSPSRRGNTLKRVSSGGNTLRRKSSAGEILAAFDHISAQASV